MYGFKTIKIPNLLYSSSENVTQPLPAWASLFLEVGVRLAERPRNSRRAIVAMALPTRAYAAAFVAAGVTMGKARVPIQSPNLESYFSSLCNLQVGTRVFFSIKQKRHKGIVIGIEQYEGQSWLKIQLTNGDKLVYFVNKREADRVEVEEWEGELPKQGKKRLATPLGGLANVILRGKDIRDFETKSRLEAFIIGSATTLRAEVADTVISARLPNGRLVSGSLQDLLRVKHLLPGKPYRTEIISDISSSFAASLVTKSAVAIFDGSRAFLKMREKLRLNNWVILLDRTATEFENAVDVLNQEYLRLHEAGREPWFQPRDTPWGVEVMAYEEAAS